ncbi:CTD small phosphatase-like protein isoform X1 [Panthera pardus]|uniref:CTD small phosphatase-like protein isoform X1 n=1 Tax=Panthera pardus TaxID=9691 RepID=A0A9W2VMR4_PANPR|nr:CTD small phosphatase-like protein isoform X1 [Panthera pardus]
MRMRVPPAPHAWIPQPRPRTPLLTPRSPLAPQDSPHSGTPLPPRAPPGFSSHERPGPLNGTPRCMRDHHSLAASVALRALIPDSSVPAPGRPSPSISPQTPPRNTLPPPPIFLLRSPRGKHPSSGPKLTPAAVRAPLGPRVPQCTPPLNPTRTPAGPRLAPSACQAPRTSSPSPGPLASTARTPPNLPHREPCAPVLRPRPPHAHARARTHIHTHTHTHPGAHAPPALHSPLRLTPHPSPLGPGGQRRGRRRRPVPGPGHTHPPALLLSLAPSLLPARPPALARRSLLPPRPLPLPAAPGLPLRLPVRGSPGRGSGVHGDEAAAARAQRRRRRRRRRELGRGPGPPLPERGAGRRARPGGGGERPPGPRPRAPPAPRPRAPGLRGAGPAGGRRAAHPWTARPSSPR